jgi:hypothetical protein
MGDAVLCYLAENSFVVEPLHYTMCGLIDVWLGNGFFITPDPQGVELFTITDPRGLDAAIGRHLLLKSVRTAAEDRFLLNLGDDLAASSRWQVMEISELRRSQLDALANRLIELHHETQEKLEHHHKG